MKNIFISQQSFFLDVYFTGNSHHTTFTLWVVDYHWYRENGRDDYKYKTSQQHLNLCAKTNFCYWTKGLFSNFLVGNISNWNTINPSSKTACRILLRVFHPILCRGIANNFVHILDFNLDVILIKIIQMNLGYRDNDLGKNSIKLTDRGKF